MRKLLIFLFILLTLNNFIFSNINNTNKDNNLIKVVYVKDSGYIEENHNGSYKGYLVDYLNNLGEFFNFRYEYILVDNIEDCYKYVKEGLADISCLQYINSEYENDIEYSKYPIKNLDTNLYTLANNAEYYFNDFENFNNMIVGLRKDLSTIDKFFDYINSNNLNLKLKYYNSEIELHEALINHEIQSMVTDYSFFSDIKLKEISEICHEPVYILTKKDNPLIHSINHSTNLLSENNSNMMNILYDKHLDNTNSVTAFSKAEQDFINKSDYIKVGLLPDTYVQSRYNTETEEFEGVIIDYLNELSKLSKLKFEYVLLPEGIKTHEAIAQGYCDISPYFVRNNTTLSNENVVATTNFIDMRQLIVMNKNNPITIDKINSVSCPSNYQGLLNFIKTDYPQWEVVKTNAKLILDPLLEGKVDVAIGNEYEIKYLMQQPKYNNLLSNETYLIDVLLSIGIDSNLDYRLLKILNKSISNMNNTTIEYIKLGGVLTNYQYTFYDSYYANRDLFNLIVFLTISIIFSLILFSRYQKNLNNEIKIKETELNLSNHKYEKANKAKTEFLASMSHDLRTPMNAIIGLTELSKDNIDNKELLDQYINKIDISSKYLLSLINDILDISAIEDGKLTVSNSPLNLKDLVQEITSMYNVNSQQKNLDFTVQLNRIYHEFLIGDYFRIKQIITNLLSNAFKFTPNTGHVNLIINEISSGKNIVLLNIIVKDTGIGIKKELQNKIFQKFVQADTETFNKYGGSGLGLSIVSNLVSLMNGTISLESYENKGSTFSVTLPLKIDLEKEKINFAVTSNNNNNILFVDNEIKSIIEINKLLKKKGVNNDYALNINEAYEKTTNREKEGKAYNILIIDNKLIENEPNFFNSKLAKYYKEKDKYLIFSGYDITSLKKSLSNKQICHFLRKPIFISSIYYILNNLDNLHSSNNKDYSIVSHELTGLKVLLCEDNNINQIVGKHLIENFGASVTIAENGEIAVQKYLENDGNNFDFILMDIRMPILNGYEATERIRSSKLKNSKDITIYALTANVTKKDVKDCLYCGMNGHISKPIDSKKLYKILEETWLKKNIILD